MKITLLFNANAGTGISRDRVTGVMERAGHGPVHVIDSHADLGEALSQPTDLLVAAGGDRTTFKAAEALAGRGIPLAILPVGTANNIAKSLGIKGSVEELVARWANARRMPLDLGLARTGWGETRFVEAVGAGLISGGIATIEADERALDGDLDSDSKIARAVRTYRDVLSRLRPRHTSVRLDGGPPIEGDYLLVEVLNIRSVGPNLVISDAADPSDGFFTVVSAAAEHREELDRYLVSRIEGRQERLSLPTVRAREVEINGWDEMHVDDEVRTWPTVGKVGLRIEPAALDVLV